MVLQFVVVCRETSDHTSNGRSLCLSAVKKISLPKSLNDEEVQSLRIFSEDKLREVCGVFTQNPSLHEII